MSESWEAIEAEARRVTAAEGVEAAGEVYLRRGRELLKQERAELLEAAEVRAAEVRDRMLEGFDIRQALGIMRDRCTFALQALADEQEGNLRYHVAELAALAAMAELQVRSW